MPRSLLSQLLQVEASATYNDAIANPHTVGVAEGQASVEGDLNVIRTLLRSTTGETNWYDQVGMTIKDVTDKYFIERIHQSGFDGVALGAGGSTTAFDTAIKTIANHNSGGGSSTAAGVVVDATKTYKLQVRDTATQNAIDDGSGNEVYGRLSWDGANYVVTWYSNVSGTETAYSFASSANLDLSLVVVSRRYADLDWSTFIDPSFHDTTGFLGSIADDNVTVNAMAFLLNGLTTQAQVNVKVDKLGSTAIGEGASGIAVNNSSSYFTGGNVEVLFDELKSQLGGDSSTTYNFTENNVVTDNDAVYAALNKLDLKWGDLVSTNTGEGASLVGIEDAGGYTVQTDVEGALQEIYGLIADVSGWEKEFETTSGTIPSGTNHTLPASLVYTLNSGKNIDVYYSGQLLVEGVGNDFQEVSTTQIKFNFTVPTGKNLTYMVRK